MLAVCFCHLPLMSLRAAPAQLRVRAVIPLRETDATALFRQRLHLLDCEFALMLLLRFLD